ncbi:MAG TPA: methyl-accepting chemotaxis protein, partial [Deltaproteobacteria bacterium]|nr:methyl-accepting chemotaxis protein [Deltaproteobacteria bacterium]
MVKKKSLGFKLIAGGIIAVLLPLFVVGVFSLMKASDALDSISNERALNVATDVAGMADLVMQEEMKIITQLSVNDAIVEAAAKVADHGTVAAAPEIKRANEALSSAISKLGNDYEDLLLAGTDGVIFADGKGRLGGISVADRDYIQAAKEGKSTIGKVIISRQTGNPIVPVCSPVYSKNGKLVGELATILSINFLSHNITNIKLGTTGYVYMVDRDGMVIAHPDKNIILKLNANNIKGMEEIAAKMMAHQTGTASYVFNGVDKMSAFAPVKFTGWNVCATQDEAEFLASAHSIRNFIFIIGGIFLAMTVIAVLFFSRSITRPITSAVAMLNEAADQVATASSQVSSASQSLA